MARDRSATGIAAIPWAHFAIGRPIERGPSVSNAQLHPLALRQNNLWADPRPPLIENPCNVSATKEYCETPSGGGSSSDIYLAWMGTFGQDSRERLRFEVWARASDGTTAGTIRMRAEDRPANLDLTVPAGTTTWTKFTGTLLVNGNNGTPPAVAGVDMVTCRMWRSSGSGQIQMVWVAAWQEPWTTNPLPSGTEASDFCANDLSEFADDMPLPVQVHRRMVTNAQSIQQGKGWLRPWIGHCTPLQDNGVAVTGKATGAYNDTNDWRPVCPPLPWPRQRKKFSLSYRLFGQRDGSSGKIRIRNPFTDDATEHDLPASPATVTTHSNWSSGTIEVCGLPDNWHPATNYLDKIRVEAISDTGGNDAYLQSIMVQETAG